MGLMLAQRMQQIVEQVLVEQMSNPMLILLALQEPKVCSRELPVVLAGHLKAGRQCLTKGQRRVLSMGLGPLPEMPGLSETTEPVPVAMPAGVQAQVPGMPVFPEARLVVLV